MDRLDILVRRFEKIFLFLVPVLAVAMAMALISIFITAMGASPLEAYSALIGGALGDLQDIATSMNRAAPYIIVGLGVAIGFRGGIFNIGGEGQIMAGGILASIVAIYIKGIPPYIHIPLSLLAGFIGGVIWGFIPGYFFAKSGTNMIITTIMMNEIAFGVLSALVKGPLQEPPGFFDQTYMIEESAFLPFILPGTRLHAGIAIAVMAAVVLYILLFRTSFGYQIRTIGENVIAAKHAGMKVFTKQIQIMIISSGLAGLAGTVEILGAQHRLRPLFLQNYGYEALAVAILGQSNPFGVIISGLLFGVLKTGAGSMQRATNLPMSLIDILSGIIIVFVVASGILMGLPRFLAKRQMIRADQKNPTTPQPENSAAKN
jgi:simple sugar transport system permease protein